MSKNDNEYLKKDCFAIRLSYLDNKKIYRCDALNILQCEGCRFYKSLEEHLQSKNLSKYGGKQK